MKRPHCKTLVPPVVEVHLPPSNTPPPVETDGRPAWAAEAVRMPAVRRRRADPGGAAGVPRLDLFAGRPELTPLFGQPEWFLGILPSQAGNLKVLDTARWVMPDRYRDDFRQGLQYVISVQGYEWGLAVHQVSRSLRLDPNEIKWRSHRGQRPWLAGTVIEHMCALLDVSALAELIASGGAKHLGGRKPYRQADITIRRRHVNAATQNTHRQSGFSRGQGMSDRRRLQKVLKIRSCNG